MTTPQEPLAIEPPPDLPRPSRISVVCQGCGKKGRLTDQRWVHVAAPEDGHAFVPKTKGAEG